MLSVCKLLLNEFLCRCLLHNVLSKSVSIADSSGHHARHGIGVLADHADNLELDTAAVKRLETEGVGAYVLIFAGRGILLPAVGGEDETEGLLADVGIAPALHFFGVDRFAADVARHGREHLGRGLEAEGVQHKV